MTEAVATTEEEPRVRPAPTAGRSLLSGGTFAIANAAQRALAFLLLPVYTAVLTPDEYGRLGLLLTIQSGASVLLAMSMEAAVLRRYFWLEGDAKAQRRFVGSAWVFLLVVSPSVALVACAVTLVAIPESPVFRPHEAALALWSAATFVAATVVPLTILRADQRLRDYVALTAVTGIATTVLTLAFVVGLDMGVKGWFDATIAANILTLIAAFVLVPWSAIDRFDFAGMRASLGLALPLIPHAASHWSLQLADRLILSGLVSASALGVYTLAANLALPALVLMQSLNQGFLPAYARRRDVPGSSVELRNTITIQVLLVLLIGLVLGLLGPPIVSVLNASYAGAADLVPWIVLGYVFLGLYYIPMNVVSLVAGRTTFVWVFTATAAAVNIAWIVVFVPTHGIKAAAVASGIGYLVLAVLTALYSRRLRLRLDVDWHRIIPIAFVSCATYLLGTFLPSSGASGLVLRGLVLTTLPWSLAAACGFSPKWVLARGRAVGHAMSHRSRL